MVELMDHQTEEGGEMVDEMVEEVEEVVSSKTRDKIPLVKDKIPMVKDYRTLYHQDARNTGRQSHRSSKPVAFTPTLQVDKDVVTAGWWVMDIAHAATRGKTSKMSSILTFIHNEEGYLPKRHPIRSI